MSIVERAEQARRAMYCLAYAVSADAPLSDDEAAVTLADRVADPGPDPEQQAIEREQREQLALRMRALDDRERAVLFARFNGWPLDAGGLAFDVSRERARQIESRAHAKVLSGGEPPPPPAPRPRPPARPAQPKATDPRRVRMISLWTALKDPGLAPEERERLRAEHAALDAAMRGEGS